MDFLFYFKHTVGFLSSRILFKDKDRNWEEIENKLRAESEVPIVKTSSMVWIVTFFETDYIAHLMAKQSVEEFGVFSDIRAKIFKNPY